MKWAAAILSCTTVCAALAIEQDLIKRDTCNAPHIAPLYFIGGEGGGAFCETKWPGPIMVSSLTTWSNGNDITGIEVEYTDGSSARQGRGFNGANSGSITLAAGELITTAWMSGNGIGSMLGAIHLETSKGQKQTLGTSSAPNTYSPELGSGLLVGITGHSGWEIDNLALMFVQPKITKITVNNVQFDSADMNAPVNPSPEFGARVHYWNPNSNATQNWTFSASCPYTESTTYTQSTTNTFGVTVGFSFEVDVPEIAKETDSVGFSWSTSTTQEVAASHSQGFTPQTSESGSLPPNSGVDCYAVVYVGSANLKYSSDVTLLFDDGETYKYTEPGNLAIQTATEIYHDCPVTYVDETPSGYGSGSLDGPGGQTSSPSQSANPSPLETSKAQVKHESGPASSLSSFPASSLTSASMQSHSTSLVSSSAAKSPSSSSQGVKLSSSSSSASKSSSWISQTSTKSFVTSTQSASKVATTSAKVASSSTKAGPPTLAAIL